MGAMAPSQQFVLVLALWGSHYGPAHVNALVEAAHRHSPGLAGVVLMTDRLREGVDGRVLQKLIPAPFDAAEFQTFGYRAKLSVFLAVEPSADTTCVYLDLDSIIIGDVGRIAAHVAGPDNLLMLPPAGLGFGSLRWFLDRVRRNPARFPVGNSSVLAFHSAADPNLARLYAQHFATGTLPPGLDSAIDDIVISAFGRGQIRAIPTDCAVMLRREFLSRIPVWPRIKSRLPWVRRRRERLAVVTLNGVSVKAETLARLTPGARLEDGRGRSAPWSEAGFGALWPPLHAASQRLAATMTAKSD